MQGVSRNKESRIEMRALSGREKVYIGGSLPLAPSIC